jgi:hypothetical protein
VIGRLARVGGVALDARFAARSEDPADLTSAATWIAANALAARDVRVTLDGEPLREPAIVGVRTQDLAGLLAAIARVPVLVDPRTIPFRWRAALGGLGIPVLEGLAHDALLRGASVAVVVPQRRQRRSDASTLVIVHAEPGGYRVRVCTSSTRSSG